MAGAGSGELFVSSWGWYTDEKGLQWRRWSVTIRNVRVCLLELPPNTTSVEAMLMASAMHEAGHFADKA